jgi:four helix bundle protein
MENERKKTGFDAYDNAVEIARSMRTLLEKVRKFDKDLADQGRRACQSMGLNTQEASRRIKGDRSHLFAVALGSAGETMAALHQAEAWGYLSQEETKEVLERLDREQAMLWKLSRK